MHRTRTTMISTTLALALLALPALAAETKSPATFATDILAPMSGAVTLSYSYSSDNPTTTITDGTDTHKRELDWQRSTMQAKAELGLGYGLQLGVAQSVEVGGKVTGSMNGVIDIDQKMSGGYNPLFELKWNPMQLLMPKHPLQVVASYRFKPKGIAAKSVYDDYTQHSGSVVASYALPELGLRPFIGYDFTTYGADEEGFEQGHVNTGTIGSELTIMNGLTATASYSFARRSGATEYLGGYNVQTIHLDAQYKIPGISFVDAYVSPFGEVMLNGSRTIDLGSSAWKATTSSYTGYKVGGLVKLVF